VRGRVEVEEGQTVLYYKGGKIRVTVFGPFSEGNALYRVERRGGKVMLHPQGGSGATKVGYPEVPGTEAASESIVQRLSFARYAAADKQGRLLNDGLDLKKIFSLLGGERAEKANQVLELYIAVKERAKERKTADDGITGGPFSSGEEELSSFIDRLTAFSDKAGGRSEDRGEGKAGGRFFFTLLRLEELSENGMVPLLLLGETGKRRRSWLFSECEFSRLGLLRFTLILDCDAVYGTIFCARGSGRELRDNLQVAARYRIVEVPEWNNSFQEWPVQAFAALSGEEFLDFV